MKLETALALDRELPNGADDGKREGPPPSLEVDKKTTPCVSVYSSESDSVSEKLHGASRWSSIR